MEAFKIRYGKDVDPGEVNGLLKNFKLTDIEADSLICKLRESYRVSWSAYWLWIVIFPKKN